MAKRGNYRGSKERAKERRNRSLLMRIEGQSYREIGRALDISEAQAHRDVMRRLLESSRLTDIEAGQLRELESQRLDILLSSVWKIASHGHLAAVDRAQRLIDQQSRLWGAYAPTKIASTDPSGKREYNVLTDDEYNARLVALLKSLGKDELAALAGDTMGGAAGVPADVP
mgnify:CR=1 FL=1